MRLVQSGADLSRNLDPFAPIDRAQALDDRSQALALDVFHREVRHRAGAGEFIHTADVLMRDPPREPYFIEEALGRHRVARDLGLQDLQRDRLVRFLVARLVDDPHAATPGFLEHLVTGVQLNGPVGGM